MFDQKKIVSAKAEYRNIYIIEDRNLWELHSEICDRNLDLVLCIDFGLFIQLKDQNYSVAFLDHLADKEVLEFGNAQMNDFLGNWFVGVDGEKLLTYKDFNIGDALLLNLLNDVTYFYHFFFNIIQIKKINYKQLFVALNDVETEQILNYSNIAYIKLECLPPVQKYGVYSFPISKWSVQAIDRTSFKSKMVDVVSKALDFTFSILDRFRFRERKTIFIQHYFPTKEIVKNLLANKNINVVLTNYLKEESLLPQRRIIYKKMKYKREYSQLLCHFRQAKKKEWIYEDISVSNYLYKKIEVVIENNLQKSIAAIESILTFFKRNELALMVPVTNLWLNNRLLMNYCRSNGIPIFMIINGLLNINHWKDGFDSDYVNCYSESMREDYFQNKEGAIALGDPRMDKYAVSKKNIINRTISNITIGAAGFDNIDLNSYLAFEFDFLFDIIFVLEKYEQLGYLGILILKVRGNGYANIYEDFIKEYFPEMKIKIEQSIPLFNVLKNTDLYISFNSQSILEAAALGIPTIYYKKDKQTIFRPYDGESELVTAYDTTELDEKINLFYNGDSCYNNLVNADVLEKYLGKLDGKNVERNLDYINTLLFKESSQANS